MMEGCGEARVFWVCRDMDDYYTLYPRLFGYLGFVND